MSAAVRAKIANSTKALMGEDQGWTGKEGEVSFTHLGLLQ